MVRNLIVLLALIAGLLSIAYAVSQDEGVRLVQLHPPLYLAYVSPAEDASD